MEDMLEREKTSWRAFEESTISSQCGIKRRSRVPTVWPPTSDLRRLLEAAMAEPCCGTGDDGVTEWLVLLECRERDLEILGRRMESVLRKLGGAESTFT